QGLPEQQLIPVSGGECITLDEATTVRVLPSLHACIWSDRPVPGVDEVCLGDMGMTWQQRQQRLDERFWPALAALGEEVREHLTLARQGDRR
ncbi:MAG: hypothetical protein ACRDSH_15480, partial [Pseudonocardiaceae bacterium]